MRARPEALPARSATLPRLRPRGIPGPKQVTGEPMPHGRGRQVAASERDLGVPHILGWLVWLPCIWTAGVNATPGVQRLNSTRLKR